MVSKSVSPAPAWLPDLLILNAVASGFTGLLLLVGGGWMAMLMFAETGTLLGLDLAAILRLAGGGLIVYAAGVAVLARGPRPAIAGLCAAFVADCGWVLGSVGLIVGLPSQWTTVGIVATMAVALAVGFFAWGEGVALLRMIRRSERDAAPAGA